MNKFIAIVVLMVIACTNAKPSIVSVAPAAYAYSAPLLAAAAPAPFVTAHSSQVVSRNYNAAYVASPAVIAAAPSPYIASVAAPFAYPSPYSFAATAPVLL